MDFSMSNWIFKILKAGKRIRVHIDYINSLDADLCYKTMEIKASCGHWIRNTLLEEKSNQIILPCSICNKSEITVLSEKEKKRIAEIWAIGKLVR
jgi:hypothetical protein